MLGPLALEQALLRERARAKHPRGAELWWTGPALEQASSFAVAAHRARRFERPVLDLCCSVGGDLLALPAGSVGVDLDEAAPTAGLSSTRSTSAAPEWSGTRLVSPPKAVKGKSRR